jgi:hypothetical protein
MNTRTINDPFTGKDVQISDKLTDRLRGKYARGPTMPNGEPEFGWAYHEVPPIQNEAADRIEALVTALKRADQFVTNGIELGYIRMPDADVPDSAHETPGIIRAALHEEAKR